MNFGCTTKTGHPDLHFTAFLLIIENNYNVHYRCKLLIYGHQFCKAAASNFNVYAPTDRFAPSLTYFSRLQGSICKRQIFGQYIRWHKSLTPWVHRPTKEPSHTLKTRPVWPILRSKSPAVKVGVNRHFQASSASPPMKCSFIVELITKRYSAFLRLQNNAIFIEIK